MSFSGEPETKDGTLGPPGKRVRVERAGSPVPSCLSMKSDASMDHPHNFRGEVSGDPRIQRSLESDRFEETSSEKLSFPKQKLITESPTRWGSRLNMIERILDQEKAISQVLKADKKTRHLVPSWQEIDVLESVKKALSPLKDFTDALSGEDYVSLSYVKSALHLLKVSILHLDDDDTELTKTMKPTIFDYLTAKYQCPVAQNTLS
ncbi:hypothetical protein SKAU_G00151800 [Synaphobranchus kaupii]|uniref:Uncharacterized protein n=1 Tax=Synaphobranchus kaupii TaxID=118154 RepID=A0A9Q1FHB7_SYNKA|nr:hypothetical protein SKAU_G00151800 [Synaphobranchus kaupii]